MNWGDDIEETVLGRISDLDLAAGSDGRVGQLLHHAYFSDWALDPSHDVQQLHKERLDLVDLLDEYDVDFYDVFDYDDYQDWYDAQ